MSDAAHAGPADHPAKHHHPNYVMTWAALVVLLGVSIGCGYLGHSVLATILVFGVSAVKAVLVGSNFMHLRSASKVPVMIAISGLAVILLFIVALLPDIVFVYGG